MVLVNTFIVIIIIAFCAGIVAMIIDLFKNYSLHKSYGIYERFIKRFLDAFFSTGATIVFLPILLVIALFVRVKLGAPVLFVQKRVGKKNKVFNLYKFRTMTNEVDENGDILSDEMRSTRFGAALRSLSLDELPEIINIIKGDMSIVGPRPLLPEYLPYYSATEIHRHDVRPGLTGLAQINGRSFLTWEQIFKYDLDYVNNVSLSNDFKIVIRTVLKVIKKENIADTRKNNDDDSNRKVHKPLNIERQ